MTAGFRILPRMQAVDPATVAAFARLPVANVSDCMSRMAAGGARLRPMHKAGGLAGPALTVKTRPGDNLMLHKALGLAQPGDVIVCDAGGDLTNSLFGELMLAQLTRRGIAGLVINGAIRDVAAIAAQSVPVFAAGVTHRGPYKSGPGEINMPVAIDGMVVMPGDLMLGDEDGLVCVPLAECQAVLAATQAKYDAEQRQMAAIQDGSDDTSWVDAELRRLGCEGLE